jgi:hypothetical protein
VWTGIRTSSRSESSKGGRKGRNGNGSHRRERCDEEKERMEVDE